MAHIRETMVDDFIKMFNEAELALRTLKALPSHQEDLETRGLTLDQKHSLIGVVQARQTELLTEALEFAKEEREL